MGTQSCVGSPPDGRSHLEWVRVILQNLGRGVIRKSPITPLCVLFPGRLGLKGTEWAQAQVDTIRLKLLKIGAIVRISVRRVLLQLSSAYPWKDLYARVFHALRC